MISRCLLVHQSMWRGPDLLELLPICPRFTTTNSVCSVLFHLCTLLSLPLSFIPKLAFSALEGSLRENPAVSPIFRLLWSLGSLSKFSGHFSLAGFAIHTGMLRLHRRCFFGCRTSWFYPISESAGNVRFEFVEAFIIYLSIFQVGNEIILLLWFLKAELFFTIFRW